MIKLTKALALASMLLLGASGLKAQDNLLLNPSFEEVHVWSNGGSYYAANHWSTPQDVGGPTLVDNGRTGKALRVNPYRGTRAISAIKTTVAGTGDDRRLVSEPNYISVTPGSEYKFSYWYKIAPGATKTPQLGIRFTWAKADGTTTINIPGQNGFALGNKSITSTEWKEESFTFTVPSSNAELAKLGFRIEIRNGDGDYIYFDDLSLVETRPAAPPTPPAPAVPTELKATNKFQRELELSWAAGTAGTTWELQVGDASPIEVNKNSHVLEDLEPNTPYAIKLRAKANNVASEWSQVLNVQTADYTERPESAARVPHLRTISEEGTCQQNLLLYYNDLAEKAATISYKVDGISITPQGKTLSFPKTGKQVLSIEIVESADKSWTLEYNVNVQ